MRTSLTGLAVTFTFILLSALPLAAQEAAPKRSLLSPDAGLMFWTLLIFVALFAILAKFAYPKILGAVEAREKALSDALAAAKRDRDEAAALLAEQQKQLAATRDDAQRIIAEGRAAGEKVRTGVIEQASAEQRAMLDRAKSEIASERDRAIAELRREAVELAIRGAGKVIEKNLDSAANRQIVDEFLGSIAPAKKG